MKILDNFGDRVFQFTIISWYNWNETAFTCSNSTMKKTTMCEIRSKLLIKTPERRHWRRSNVSIVNIEQILYIVLAFPRGEFGTQLNI